MTALKYNASTEALEKVLLHRLTIGKEDSSVATIAKEYLYEIELLISDEKGTPAAFVEAGRAAIRVWPTVVAAEPSLDVLYPKTRDVLWNAAVQGWMNATGMNEQEEFSRFIAFEHGVRDEKMLELMLTRVKEQFDARGGSEVTVETVVSFLDTVGTIRGKSTPIIKAVGRMLGRYLHLEYSLFCAHLLFQILMKQKMFKWEQTHLALISVTRFMSVSLSNALDTTILAWMAVHEAGFHDFSYSNPEVNMIGERSFALVWDPKQIRESALEDIPGHLAIQKQALIKFKENNSLAQSISFHLHCGNHRETA